MHVTYWQDYFGPTEGKYILRFWMYDAEEDYCYEPNESMWLVPTGSWDC